MQLPKQSPRLMPHSACMHRMKNCQQRVHHRSISIYSIDQRGIVYLFTYLIFWLINCRIFGYLCGLFLCRTNTGIYVYMWYIIYLYVRITSIYIYACAYLRLLFDAIKSVVVDTPVPSLPCSWPSSTYTTRYIRRTNLRGFLLPHQQKASPLPISYCWLETFYSAWSKQIRGCNSRGFQLKRVAGFVVVNHRYKQ